MSKLIKCEKCKKDIFSQGYKKHTTYCDGTGISNKNRNKSGRGRNWLKGLTLPEEQRMKIKNSLQKRYNNGDLIGFKKWMNENPELHRKTASLGGGLRKGCGRGKKGWYKGYWCDSSWELAFIIYHLDFNNKIERNNSFFNYIYNEKNYKYYPDFILNDEYIEIKGYENEKSREKKKQFPYKLNTYYSKEMKPILKYVIEKYGKDFIDLYDNDKLKNIRHKNKENKNKLSKILKILNKKNRYNECECGNKKLKNSSKCNNCNNIKPRKVERPSYEQLIKEINELNYCGVGRKYGVSDNAIRKWKKYYERNRQIYPLSDKQLKG